MVDKKKPNPYAVVDALTSSISKLILIILALLGAIGILLSGGVGALTRFIIAAGSTVIIAIIILFCKLSWAVRGRRRGWIIILVSLPVFIVMSKLPEAWLPGKPLSLIDMIQGRASLPLIMAVCLILVAVIALLSMLSRRKR